MSRRWQWLWLAAILLFGFALRVYQLDDQSMWSDEGLSLYRARQALPDLLAGTIVIDGQASQDTNPPLYFVLLHGLRAVGGESVFALRYLGVLAAILNLPLLFVLARRLAGWPAGVLAIFWLALSPFHVWQSQEMRNYTLLLFWNLLAAYALSRIVLRRTVPHGRWLLLWGAATLAGIYTHYFGLFMLAFGLAALAVWGVWRWQGWPPPRWLMFAVAGTGLAVLPLALAALSRFRAGPQVDFYFVQPHHFLTHVLSVYGVGIAPDVVQPWQRVAPVALLTVWGVVQLWRAERKTAVLFLSGYWFIPLFLLESLSYFNPLYNGARHLLVSLPPFVVLLAAAFYGWPRQRAARAAVAALALIAVASQTEWLYRQFTADELVKDDIRGAALYLNEAAQPGDVIVLHDTIIGFVFDYYYEGAAPWTAVPAWNQRDQAAALDRLQSATAGATRVWFLTEPKPRIGFPADVLPAWAAANWTPFQRQRFPFLWLSTALEGYVVDPQVTAVPPQVSLTPVEWQNGLRLAGFDSPAEARAGGLWQPIFYWSRMGGPAAGAGVSLRLVDAAGQIWLQDDQLLWREYPPPLWMAEAPVRVQPLIALPAGLPPGEYRAVLRLVDGEALATIPTTGGQIDVTLPQPLTVRAATAPDDLAALPHLTPTSVRLNREIELIGYALPPGSYRPGHLAQATLFWRVHRPPDVDYRLLAQFVDAQGVVGEEVIAAPTRADYPTSAWRAGELLQGRVLIPTPGLADGAQTLRVTLLDTDGQPVRPPVELGAVQVEPWEMETEFPPIEIPLQATFGEPAFADLEGYELSGAAAAGERLTLTLFWRAVAPLNRSLVVFVHLADETEELVGQGDGVPVNGSRLTNSWRSGEALVDRHTVQIRPETAVGAYQLWIGFYDPATNERLPVFVDGVEQPDGRLFLTEITVR